MAEMKPPENVKKAKIRTPIAEIIVEGRNRNGYYSILYLDPSDGKLHIGFSSSSLDFVRKWLEEEFEVDESIESDFTNVAHCRDCANFRQNVHGVCWCDEYGGAIMPEDYCSRAVTDRTSRMKIPWEAD